MHHFPLDYCPFCGHLLIEYTEFPTGYKGSMTVKECIWCNSFKQKEAA